MSRRACSSRGCFSQLLRLEIVGITLAELLKPAFQPFNQLAGGVPSTRPQQMITRRNLDEHRDVATGRYGHHDNRYRDSQDVRGGHVESQPVVLPGLVPPFQVNDELDALR